MEAALEAVGKGGRSDCSAEKFSFPVDEKRHPLSSVGRGTTIIMKKSKKVVPTTKGGRPPPGGGSPYLTIRMPPALVAEIEALARAKQLGRSQACRLLVELGLQAIGLHASDLYV